MDQQVVDEGVDVEADGLALDEELGEERQVLREQLWVRLSVRYVRLR